MGKGALLRLKIKQTFKFHAESPPSAAAGGDADGGGSVLLVFFGLLLLFVSELCNLYFLSFSVAAALLLLPRSSFLQVYECRSLFGYKLCRICQFFLPLSIILLLESRVVGREGRDLNLYLCPNSGFSFPNLSCKFCLD